MKLPKLYSLRQAAILTGISYARLWNAARRGRIPSSHCQLVDGRWILAEGFRIMPTGMPQDKLIAELPAELISDEVYINPSAVLPVKNTERKHIPRGDQRKVAVWGFDRNTVGLSRREIYRRTGVHMTTLAKLADGKQVRPGVVVRLSRGLGVDIEELLRKD